MNELTPGQIVEELDRYIIGQDEAKRSVAIALRNRWRRRNVSGPIRDEILPNNIIMIGPTGVGKTEIARRLARLAQAPFIKVEATKYTEVGYVGRDVDSMIRDLVEIGITMEKEKAWESIAPRARERAAERLIDLLIPPSDRSAPESHDIAERRKRTREKLRGMLEEGALNAREVTVETVDRAKPFIEIFTGTGIEEMGVKMPEGLEGLVPKRRKGRRVSVPEAWQILEHEECDKLIDQDAVTANAIRSVEESGIVFIDEIDKIASTGIRQGPDVSREGVQRDILPIIEGSAVNTKYGPVRTDHILFIAAGAFHMSKPSDLVPELQGRFPIRVELHALSAADFKRILTEPENALIRQYAALMETEGCRLTFTDDAISEIARLAYAVNQRMENIGARRLHTILTSLLEDILFDLPTERLQDVKIDRQTVTDRLEKIVADDDLARYIL